MNFNSSFQMNASLEIFSAIVIFILSLAYLFQKNTKDKMFKWFFMLLILSVLMMSFDAPTFAVQTIDKSLKTNKSIKN